jgi:hypothetical protein
VSGGAGTKGGVRSILLIIIAVGLGAAREAGAQSEATLVPAVALTTTHDDNLFSAPKGVGDIVTYIRPSLEGRYRSPTTDLQSLVSFDVQRSAFHRTLNTLDARRHAMFDGRAPPTPAMRLGLTSRYDYTQNPGELNLDTGIMLDRQRARRLQLTPSLAYRTTPRTTISTRYDWTSERLSDWGGGELHAAHFGVAHERTPRTTVNARYLGRVFRNAPATHQSHTALVGWSREMTPGTSLSLEAGPRVRSYGGVTSEVLAGLLRRTPRTRLRLDYWQGETIVLGIAGPVQIQSGTTNLSWALRRYLELGTIVGVFKSRTLEETSAVVYHASIATAWVRQPYIVTISYGSDMQKGDIRSRGAVEEYVRRGVFLVRLTVAPRLSRAFRGRDGDQPLTPLKGVIE